MSPPRTSRRASSRTSRCQLPAGCGTSASHGDAGQDPGLVLDPRAVREGARLLALGGHRAERARRDGIRRDHCRHGAPLGRPRGGPRRRRGRRHHTDTRGGRAVESARDVLRPRPRPHRVGGDESARAAQPRVARADGRVHRGRVPDVHARGVGGLAGTLRRLPLHAAELVAPSRSPRHRRHREHRALAYMGRRRLPRPGSRSSLHRQHAHQQPVGDGVRLQRSRAVRLVDGGCLGLPLVHTPLLRRAVGSAAPQ